MSESLNNMTLRATLIIILLILALGGSWVWFLTRKPEIIEKERIVVETHTDTVTVEKPVPVVKYRDRIEYVEVPYEKVVFRDSLVFVMLPREVKEYRDSTYYCKISGIEPDLELIQTYNTTTTITQERYIKQKPIITFGIGIGVGYDPVHKTCSPTISAQATIPLYSVYGR